jgi:hypothetical protein
MSGSIDINSAVLSRELDQTIGRLLPAVEDLLERISNSGIVMIEGHESEVRVLAPLRFPDGIGRGEVVARLFRWRNTVRLDMHVEHNRVLARRDGTSSGRRCFLNDFQASTTIAVGIEELPADFRRQVIAGTLAARDAVQRYNRNHRAPWSEMRVAAEKDTLDAT